MTNSEAIKSMRNLDDLISITESEHESVKTAISALEHNSTLIEHISNLQNENTDFFNKLVESERENAKLKAEIEQLNLESYELETQFNILMNKCNVLEWNNSKFEIIIAELEAELEQSVKLPCNVGDVVYIIGKCKDFPPKLDGTMWDSDGGFGTATGYYCPYEDSDLCPFKDLEDCSFAEDKLGIFEDVVCHICIEEDKMWYVCENSNGYETSDFGKTIFLTKEEAEQHLKGKVKE